MKQQTFIARDVSKDVKCLNPWDTQQSRVFAPEGVAPTAAGADGGGGRNPAGLVFCANPHCEPELARTLTARGDSSPCADRGQNVVALPAVSVHQNGTGELSVSDTAKSLTTISTGSCRNAPLVAHPEVTGTLCASGAGLSRPAGMASEPDLCVAIPIHDRATRHQGGGPTRDGDGSGNGLGVGKAGDPAPTLTSGDHHSVAAVDCRNYKEVGDVSGTLQAKDKPGYSLNYQNPIRKGYIVRRLTPTECERLQGFPDGWTKTGHDAKEISDTRRYQMLGNSVAVPCVAFILSGVAGQLSSARKEAV
jgi:DNA (cytosine-5)-methyltransferase 1